MVLSGLPKKGVSAVHQLRVHVLIRLFGHDLFGRMVQQLNDKERVLVQCKLLCKLAHEVIAGHRAQLWE